MTHRPDGHQPRGGPAYEARWPEDVHTLVVGQFGVQAATREAAEPALAALVEQLRRPHGPVQIERAWHTDPAGAVNEVLICYWLDPAEHAAWWTATKAWWNQLPVDGPIGHWMEILTSPVRRAETMYSAPVPVGPAALADGMTPTDLHDYNFAVVDRIPDSEHPAFTTPDAAGGFDTDRPAGQDSRGRRVTVIRAPANLCLIRTAQNWALAPAEQVEHYERGVEPGYQAGVAYMNDNPAESGCVSARMLQEVDEHGAELPSSCTIAWWNSVDDLLRWAHHHPTHHRILGDFWNSLVVPYQQDLRLMLWHEVHVARPGAVRMQYVNCHDRTGALSIVQLVDQQLTTG